MYAASSFILKKEAIILLEKLWYEADGETEVWLVTLV